MPEHRIILRHIPRAWPFGAGMFVPITDRLAVALVKDYPRDGERYRRLVAHEVHGHGPQWRRLGLWGYYRAHFIQRLRYYYGPWIFLPMWWTANRTPLEKEAERIEDQFVQG